MSFDSSRRILGQFSSEFSVKAFSAEHERLSAAVASALTQSNRWNQRDCPLKPRLVFWLVLFLNVYRDLSIPAVFDVLLDFLRGREPSIGLKSVTPEALCHARERLSSEPLRLVFQELSSSMSPWVETYKGHRKLGLDGTYLRVPDTKANVEAFKKKSGRTEAAYPQLLAMALVELSTHKTLDVEIADCLEHEGRLAKRVVDRSLGTGDLVILDRGLPSFDMFLTCQNADARFLARISTMWHPRPVTSFGTGDDLVRVFPCSAETKRLRKLGLVFEDGMILRMITYHMPDGEVVRLLTDLLDHSTYPAEELAQLYHERWETELVFDELKTHFLRPAGGAQPTNFRSKKPDGVRQEVYGALIAYNLVRDLMVRSAQAHALKPLQLSFVGALRVIKLWAPRLERVSTTSDDMSHLLADIAACRLRPRRPRRCPRAVKVKMTKFKKKQPGQRESSPRELLPIMGNPA